MSTSEDANGRASQTIDARAPVFDETVFEDPALELSDIQQAFDKAYR